MKSISLRQKGKGSGIKVCARRHLTSSGCFKLGARSLLWPRLEVYVSLLQSIFSYTSSIITLAVEFPPLLPSPTMPAPTESAPWKTCHRHRAISSAERRLGVLMVYVLRDIIIAYAPKPKFDLSIAINFVGWTLLPGISIDTSVCADSVCSGAS